jgi:DNA-binding transcriptional ArsR family regulator
MAETLPDSERSPSIDSLFDALSDRRRRVVVRYLIDRTDRTAHVETLAAELCRAASADPGAFEATLRHVHLPKLADVGLVAYDESDGTVRYRDHPAVESLLETAAPAEREPVAAGN